MKHALRKTAYLPNQTCYPHPSDLRKKLPFIPICFGLPVDHYQVRISKKYALLCLHPGKLLLYFGHLAAPNPYNQIAALA